MDVIPPHDVMCPRLGHAGSEDRKFDCQCALIRRIRGIAELNGRELAAQDVEKVWEEFASQFEAGTPGYSFVKNVIANCASAARGKT